MTPINREALAEIVIKRLKTHDSPDDIIFEISNLTAWDWDESRGFLNEVAAERGVELASWEMREFSLLGGAFILVGTAMVAMGVMYFFGDDGLLSTIRDLNLVLGFTDLQLLGIAMFTGLTMIAGGVIGIIRASRRLA